MKTCSLLFLYLICLKFPLSAQVAQDLFHKGEQFEKAGKTDEAILAYSQTIERDSTFLNAFLKRSYLYLLQNNHQSAISDYSRVLRMKPGHSWALLSRGSAYLKLGLNELALHDFNTLIDLEPENTEAYNNRGWVKRNMGDQQGACQDWKKSKKLGNEEAKIILKNSGCK